MLETLFPFFEYPLCAYTTATRFLYISCHFVYYDYGFYSHCICAYKPCLRLMILDIVCHLSLSLFPAALFRGFISAHKQKCDEAQINMAKETIHC